MFVLAHGAHDIALSLLVPLLPLIRDEFGLSYLKAGLLVSAYSITSGFSQIPMGWMADRLGPKRMAVAGLIGVGMTALCLSLTHTFSQMLPVLIMMGIIAGAYHPSAISQIPRYFPEERRGRALGFHLVGGNIGFMLGPFLAGIIAGIYGWRIVYLVLSMPAILTALLLMRSIKKEWEAPREKGAKNPSDSILQTFRSIAFILSASVLVQFIVGSAINFIPIYFVDMHGINPAHAAILLALVRVGSTVASPLGGYMSDKLGIRRTVTISVAGVGPMLFLVAILPFNLFLTAFMLSLLGLFLMMRQAPMQALIVEVTSDRNRSMMLGLYFFLSLEGRSIMVPLAGYFMDIFGLFPAFVGMAAATLIVSATTLLLRSKL